MTERKATVLLGQELKCKNGCGYFGNPEWQGYCSQCHRELHQKIKPDTKGSSKKVVRSYSDVHESALSLGFSKFEEKKKQHSEKRSKTIKSIIKRGHTLKEGSAQSPSRDVFATIEITKLSKDLQLKDTILKDVVKQIQKQLDLMSKYYDKSIDEQSEVMQDFYKFMSNRCDTHPFYKELTTEQVDLLMDKIEEQLMIHMHRTVFQQISTEYEEKDLALQKRIRSLNWITPQRLGLEIKESSPDARELIDKAITDVIEMDSKIAPQKKISCIVKCSRNIFDIINLCQGVTASADEFLPAMVYIVLKANPPLLQSNMKYITSYSIPIRLRSGEGAYYFTNLCCAVEFIEHLTSESLNLSNEEFQRYLSGEVPVGYSEQSVTACEGLRLMNQNLTTLNEIQEKNNQVLNDMYTLREEMGKFQESILKGKPSKPLVICETPYTVPPHTDMSLIPEILRSRVVREGPEEDILIDIGHKLPDEKLQEENKDASASYAFSDNNTLSDFHSISLMESEVMTPALTDSISSLSMIQPLHVALPTPSATDNQSCKLFSDANNPTTPDSSQTVLDIKDLEYPTEIFPDMSGDSPMHDAVSRNSAANALSCVNDAKKTETLFDPLSHESGFMEENLNLPPPLLPVVVQNVNAEPNNKKT